MPNMSYCMFENTGRAVNQLMAEMESQVDQNHDVECLGLSEYEQSAWNDLPEQVVRFLELWLELEVDDDARERVQRLVDERLSS